LLKRLATERLRVVKILSITLARAKSGQSRSTLEETSLETLTKRADMLTTAESPGSPSIQNSPQKLPHRFAIPATDRILVVEDDRAVQKALKRLFEAEGYAVQIAPDGNAAVETFRAGTPSAVVLDLRLPGISGSEVCREFKTQSPGVPIIVLSATSDVSDKVLLLELGADDYVTKPFSPRELLARVRAALRRTTRPKATEKFSFEDIHVDFSKMEIIREGKVIALTAQEFKTLKFMVQNAERVITRDELLNEVWGYHNYPSTRTVDNHILKLRQKLERDPANPVHFRTVHGVGYKFVG
jgi:DNA-binding response OmpR family regulator